MHLFKIFLVAVALGLDVFAVGIGVGVRGASLAQKVRIGIAFASAEVGMNLLGVLLGKAIGAVIGDAAGYVGFAALIAFGSYVTIEALRETGQRRPLDFSRGWGLFIASLSISLDSLGIGFSILYIGVPLALALGVIFAVSICATAAGLALGRLLGRRVEERAEMFSGIILALTGIGFVLAKALRLG